MIDLGEMKLRILSLGAGVQSSTLALMAKHGEIEMPDCAIFSDTGWEPSAVYKWLEFLKAELPFPVYVVYGKKGNIRDATIAGIGPTRFIGIPFFTSNGGRGKRQCTGDFKIKPIIQKTRELLGVERGRRVPKRASVTQLIGISRDEAHRMKPSQHSYITHEWPLIDAGMTRWDCYTWLAAHGYPRPPKSSCIGCPYHDDDTWRRMKAESPDEFADAVYVDHAIRSLSRNGGKRARLEYMHKSCQPLDVVDFSTLEERGQSVLEFGDECEGMCGL